MSTTLPTLFTDRTRKIMLLAREYAHRSRNRTINPEHLLHGLLVEGQGVGAAALLNLGVDIGITMSGLDEFVRERQATENHPESWMLKYSEKGLRVLRLSPKLAKELGHSYVGTEHLLLGILTCYDTRASKILRSQGMTIPGLKKEIVRLLS